MMNEMRPLVFERSRFGFWDKPNLIKFPAVSVLYCMEFLCNSNQEGSDGGAGIEDKVNEEFFRSRKVLIETLTEWLPHLISIKRWFLFLGFS